MSKLCFILFNSFLLFNYNLKAQTYSLKKEITEDEKIKIKKSIKELFIAEPNFTYSFQSGDFVTKIADMPIVQRKDKNYLSKLLIEFKKDSLNCIAINNIGNYYNEINEKYNADYYFQMAYNNLDIKYFKNDSGNYLAFRGILKLNLGIENGDKDLEKSLEINPIDTIAIMFYPLSLMMKGDFEKADKFLLNGIEKKSSNFEIIYTLLCMSKMYDAIMNTMSKINTDTTNTLKTKYRQLDYDSFINLSLIHKIADENKNNTYIKYQWYALQLTFLSLKIFLFETDSTSKPIFSYTIKEKQQLKFLEKEFLDKKINTELNEYCIHKMLGIIYFLTEKIDNSLIHFEKAIQLFPYEKLDKNFNPADNFNNLILLYNYKKDYFNYKKLILKKIELKAEFNENALDYLNLALQYFQEDNLEKALEFALKAKSINHQNINILKFLAHLYYLDNKIAKCEFYIKEASKHIQNDNQNAELTLLVGAYFIINGKTELAYSNLISAKNIYNNKCKLCDKLINEYILVNY